MSKKKRQCSSFSLIDFLWQVRWPDDWTSTTLDGKRSAQFEETILITETGCEVLTKGTYIPEGAKMNKK